MNTTTTAKFARGDYSTLGDGFSIEHRDADGHTLAYLDYAEDGQTAKVDVFDPHTGRSRSYAARPAGRAFQIVERHLHKLGYLPGDLPMEDEEPAVAQVESVYADPAVRAAVGAVAQQELALQTEPAGPVPVPYVPATTSPAPPAAGETAGDWQQRVQEHFIQPAEALAQPEFRSVAEAADAILGEPADDIVRHWISSRGTIYQLHLRAICPAQETADALRAFVDSDAHGYTRSRDGRIWLWSSHAWNVGYAVVLPAE
jgi:hypothetical protein